MCMVIYLCYTSTESNILIENLASLERIMHYYLVALLSSILMLAILCDVIRFPLLRKDRGSRFFAELTIVYSIYIVLSLLLLLGRDGRVTYPLTVHRVLWTLHALAIPFLLSTWMHFNAINVMDDPKQVTILSLIHDIPLAVLAVAALLDIPAQQFYPLNGEFNHLLGSTGSAYILILSWFFCFAMLMPTLGHSKDLQGSFLFVSLLLPLCFAVSLIALQMTHSTVLFMMVNAFMLVLYYLIGQRDSITFDSLTGLPTESLLERKLIRIFRFQSPYALILVDLENFPYYSTLYGASVAQQLLSEVGKFLKTLAKTNEVFRMENNRFCLCVPQTHGRMSGLLVQKIRNRMKEQWELAEKAVYIQVNLGILSIPKQAASMQEYKAARKQMLQQSESVRKRAVFFYTKEDAQSQQQTMNIVSALRTSIRNPDQVKVYYQPIYDVASNLMVSAEALMRIEDEHLGFLRPGQFIPLAEQTGLIVDLTQILLAKVCKLVKQNPTLADSLEYISVNLSGEDFKSKQIAHTLLSIIEGEHIDGRSIGFEITETVVLQSYEMAANVMLELSQKDIHFSLDDFGSGYSNLQALMDLPYRFVKFDKSVIQGAMANATMLTLLSEMLHKLGKTLVAEGVETEEQLAMVKGIGIERVQGMLFSKPLDEQAFLALVK